MKKKKINYLHGSVVKPSKNSVREFFFSWIFDYFDKLYVLDLFSGSGVFGFEFLSRGVKKIVMLEKNFYVYRSILKNCVFFTSILNRCYIILYDSYDFIKKFNFFNVSLVIFDPPYNFSKFRVYFFFLNKNFFLKKCVLIFIESNNEYFLNFIPYNWFILKKKFFGSTYCYFFKKL